MTNYDRESFIRALKVENIDNQFLPSALKVGNVPPLIAVVKDFTPFPSKYSPWLIIYNIKLITEKLQCLSRPRGRKSGGTWAPETAGGYDQYTTFKFDEINQHSFN